MIDLHYWPTPNGWKITIALEELALAYKVVPVNIGRGEQFKADFLSISPNNRMPAILDRDPPGGGEPISIFESGAILTYLAEKTGRLGGGDLRSRVSVNEWLMWQMGGVGPMLGQYNHFARHAPERLPYAIERYTKEADRLFGVLDRRLSKVEYLAGDYSIADIAVFSWVNGHHAMGLSVEGLAHVQRWLEALRARPAVEKGLAIGKDLRAPVMDDEAKKVLFGQGRDPAPR